LKKLNGDSKPNIIPIVYTDLPEILSFITLALNILDQFPPVKEGTKVVLPLVQAVLDDADNPSSIIITESKEEFEIEYLKNPQTLEFWNCFGVLTTKSRKFRLSCTEDYDETSKTVDTFYFNAPNLNPNLPNFLGPIACLTRTDIDQFLKAVSIIQSRCPPLEAMK